MSIPHPDRAPAIHDVVDDLVAERFAPGRLPPPDPRRLSCRSRDQHDPHEWTGQTTGRRYSCAGGDLMSRDLQPGVGGFGLETAGRAGRAGIRSRWSS